MKLRHCDREHEVVHALRSGSWPTGWNQELRLHMTTCPVCAEVVFVVQEFQREEALVHTELQAREGLPSAGLVWWKARRAARRAAEQRAVEPIAWVERGASALVALTVLLLAVWQWPRLAAWFRNLQYSTPSGHLLASPAYSSRGDWLHQLGQVWTTQTSFLLLVAGGLALLSVMAFALYEEWREG
ncbi:MAG TPA: hypothetical protein VMO17_18750 [Terriglobia bacterium]|nr:hypothetical protein [Terriglobia bacterium]